MSKINYDVRQMEEEKRGSNREKVERVGCLQILLINKIRKLQSDSCVRYLNGAMEVTVFCYIVKQEIDEKFKFYCRYAESI